MLKTNFLLVLSSAINTAHGKIVGTNTTMNKHSNQTLTYTHTMTKRQLNLLSSNSPKGQLLLICCFVYHIKQGITLT